MPDSTRRLAIICLAVLATVSLHARTALAADCSIDVNSASMPTPQPVLLTQSTSQGYSSFLKPNGKGRILATQGQQVTIACPGTSFFILNEITDSVVTICEGDTLFRVEGGTQYSLNALACSDTVSRTLRFTGASCGFRNSFGVAEVGFTVGEAFYHLYDVCFSNRSLSAAYAHHTISSDVGGAQKLTGAEEWVDGSAFGKVKVEDAYTEQNLTLEALGVNSSAYLTDEQYLVRGALAPAADFLLESHQAAAFFGVNSVPRWALVDSGNWATLEDALRNVATVQNRELDVYTGTHGVLALPNSEGVVIHVYLAETSGKNKVLPVPRYLWKIVHDQRSGLGAAFVTVNNPFATEEELKARYQLCKDICEKIDWIKWDQSNNTLGMSYCCDYLEFKKNVPTAPDIGIKTYTDSSEVAVPALWLLLIFASVSTVRNVFSSV